jgi:hypothetical protein
MKTKTTPIPSFDHEAVLHDKLQPLIRQIQKICAEHQLPMLTAIVYKCQDHKKETDYAIALMGCDGKDGWLPDELILAGGILTNQAKAIPVNPLKMIEEIFKQRRESKHSSN